MNLFAFETAFNDGLRCVPMAVRMKLDMAGVKLGLDAWVKFTEEERRELLSLSPGADFRHRVRALTAAHTGSAPKDMSLPARFPWDETLPPPDLADKARQENVSLDKWPALSSLQRFALIKLSRPSHENHNFLPACREFGLSAAADDARAVR